MADGKRILPVVHLRDPEHAVAQVSLALEAGASGVFLIDHHGSVDSTGACLAAVRQAHPAAYVGVNLLSLPFVDAVREIAGWPVDALWSDNAGIDEARHPSDQPLGALLLQAKAEAGVTAEVFGGVAFKYQRQVADEALSRAAAAASPWLDVITTSGPGTGHGIALGRLSALRSGMTGGARLAVASGVVEATIASILEVADDVLVASSICSDFHTFDAEKLGRLVEAAGLP